MSAEGNKTGEFRVTYSSSGFKEDDVILLAAIGPTGDMRLQTGGDRSPEMLAGEAGTHFNDAHTCLAGALRPSLATQPGTPLVLPQPWA